MWTFVTASWWYAMAAWLDKQKEFCLYVANAIDDTAPTSRVQETAADLDRRYGLTEKGWQEDDPACEKCNDTGVIDWGSGWGPYWDTLCDCPAADALPDDHRLKRALT